MPKISANGLETHYMRMGRGTENLIMLHGLTGNLAMWHLRMVGRLQKDFRIVTYDLRGHGYTEMPPTGYTTKHLVEDLKGLLDALEIERTSLVGHSFGSDVALHFALLYPERVNKIIAMEPGLAAMVHTRNREEWEGWRYWREALGEFGIDVPKEHYFDYEYMLKLSLKVPKVFGPATGRERKPEPLLKLLDTTTLIDDYEKVDGFTLEKVEQIHTPVKLVYGENSAFLATYDYLKEHLPNCEPGLLPSSKWGHFGPLEFPDLLAQQIRDFCGVESDELRETA